MCVPVRVGSRTVGTISIYRGRNAPFDGDALARAMSLADHAGIAIENARLYGEAERRRREAEELTKMARSLTESLDTAAVGRRIVEASAGNLKRVQLELGGKGANVVFADADLDAARNGSAFAIFHNQGQACIAGSRLILHDEIAEEFLDGFVELARSIRLGPPLDPATEMGPLTSPMHRDRVLGYVKVAVDEGGEVLAGGREPSDPALAAGCYVEPTVVRADPTARVCREEVFGPFVTVTTFRTDEEAIALANSTDYGLGAGLWTRDLSRAHVMARAFRSGMVWVNSYKRVSPGSPFGGVGQSGYGREMGFEAMHGYTEAKSVWVNVDARLPVWYPRPAGG
jgi:aldehyde dehydrogenase (NAD+)/betaine-aldehyde dehydrogenase